MSRHRPPSQPDLFGQAELFPVRMPEAISGRSTCPPRSRRRWAGRSRSVRTRAAIVAARMSEMTGREITVDALYAYTAASKPEHDMGIDALRRLRPSDAGVLALEPPGRGRRPGGDGGPRGAPRPARACCQQEQAPRRGDPQLRARPGQAPVKVASCAVRAARARSAPSGREASHEGVVRPRRDRSSGRRVAAGRSGRAGAPHRPGRLAQRFRAGPAAAGRGGGFEYHLSLLPADIQARLVAREALEAAEQPPHQNAPRSARAGAEAREPVAALRGLPDKAKQVARDRLAAVQRIETLSAGMTRQLAVALVARESGNAPSTLSNWLRLAAESRPATGWRRWRRATRAAPSRRTATRAPSPSSPPTTSGRNGRISRPATGGCRGRRRRRLVADTVGKDPQAADRARLPRRRARCWRGRARDAAKRIYPHQRRDRSVFHAMQAVNADGHGSTSSSASRTGRSAGR